MPRNPIPWPIHWYAGHYDIRCIVPHCDFVTDVNKLPEQWTQLSHHCTSTAGAEHDLLGIMLLQHKCALCVHPTIYGRKDWVLRGLAEHEEQIHGSAAMFRIDSFVVLAREDRIEFHMPGGRALEEDCRRLAFDRMMDKFLLLPAGDLRLLFERSGFRDEGYSFDNLAAILTLDPLVRPEEDDPYWKPLRPDRFLAFCRPGGDEPAGSNWRRVWTDLRWKYAEGRI